MMLENQTPWAPGSPCGRGGLSLGRSWRSTVATAEGVAGLDRVDRGFRAEGA